MISEKCRSLVLKEYTIEKAINRFQEVVEDIGKNNLTYGYPFLLFFKQKNYISREYNVNFTTKRTPDTIANNLSKR